MTQLRQATCSAHGNTVNHLVKEGKIPPVKMTFPSGRVENFNSTWAATDFLHDNPDIDRTKVKITSL